MKHHYFGMSWNYFGFKTHETSCSRSVPIKTVPLHREDMMVLSWGSQLMDLYQCIIVYPLKTIPSNFFISTESSSKSRCRKVCLSMMCQYDVAKPVSRFPSKFCGFPQLAAPRYLGTYYNFRPYLEAKGCTPVRFSVSDNGC